VVSRDSNLSEANFNKNRVFKGHKHSANYILFYKNDIFLTVSDDATIKFWNLNKDEEENNLIGHTSWVITANIMKNGSLITSGADKSVRFWSDS
jgi:WD40 repeat protein